MILTTISDSYYGVDIILSPSETRFIKYDIFALLFDIINLMILIILLKAGKRQNKMYLHIETFWSFDVKDY